MRPAFDLIHLNLFICTVEALTLKVRWTSCNNLSHRRITVSAWDYWSIVPSMGDLIRKIAVATSVVIGWHVRHFLIM